MCGTDMKQCQGNSLFPFSMTQKLHDSIEKASKDTQPVYTRKSLSEAKKNINESVDHILQHDVLWENPLAAEFVSEMETEVQDIKECFNTTILSFLGSKNGQDNELRFPLFKNKQTLVIEKRFKRYAG